MMTEDLRLQRSLQRDLTQAQERISELEKERKVFRYYLTMYGVQFLGPEFSCGMCSAKAKVRKASDLQHDKACPLYEEKK